MQFLGDDVSNYEHESNVQEISNEANNTAEENFENNEEYNEKDNTPDDSQVEIIEFIEVNETLLWREKITVID